MIANIYQPKVWRSAPTPLHLSWHCWLELRWTSCHLNLLAKQLQFTTSVAAEVYAIPADNVVTVDVVNNDVGKIVAVEYDILPPELAGKTAAVDDIADKLYDIPADDVVTVESSAVDAEVDTAVDAEVDAAVDAEVDAAVDAEVDAAVDTAVDAAVSAVLAAVSSMSACPRVYMPYKELQVKHQKSSILPCNKSSEIDAMVASNSFKSSAINVIS